MFIWQLKVNRHLRIIGGSVILIMMIACHNKNVESLTDDNSSEWSSEDTFPKKIINEPEVEKNWIESIEEVQNSPLDVEYLIFREQGFSKFPEEVLLCENLKELDISMNLIESLPVEINMLKKLESLTIAYSPLRSLPPEIGDLKNLKYLNLLDNELKTVPETIGRLTRLKFLNLSLNPIEDIPENISNLRQLERLGLHGKTES